MAINTKYNIKTQNGIYQTMHFETNANQVITTNEKQFVSKAEKEIWNNMSSSGNVQEQINSSINKLKEEVEPKIIKKSAFNKHFGNGPDSVAEGDHVHNDVALKIKNIENKLNLSNSIVNSQEFFSDITPESSIWSATSGKYVSNIIKEDGRFQFDVTNVDQGLETETLTSLLPTLTTGTEVAISCNVESENTIVYIKLKYSTGWEFVRMRINDDLFKTVKIKEGLIDFKLAIESSLSSKNTCIVTNLKLMIKNPVQITSNQDIPNRNYSIWSWTTDSVLDAHDTSVFLKNYKINKVYQHFDLDSLTYNDIRNYVKVLQEKDIMVNWLTGDPSWALTNKHSKILNAIRKINDYNKYITNGYQKINTIQFDIEPYALDEWSTDEQGVIEQYQEAISIAYEECLRLGLSLAICIPSWFDSKTYSNKFGEGNLYDFVSKNSSCTVLMAYNVNKYLSISADEIKMNKENRKRIAIGLETKPVGEHSLTTDETFGDKPISDLYSAFETIYQYLSTISFDDRYEFAIHDLVAFKNYTASFDLDIVSFEGDGPLSSKENIVLKSNSGLSGTYKTEVKSGNNILEITSTDADINNKGLIYNGNVVYHAGNKPTANEINAASILHTHTGTQVALTGYAKPTTTSAIATTDNVNVAIGKLEKALDGKQATGSYAAANHNHDSAYLGKTATAAAATKLVTARTINGVAFDGTTNITITANPNAHNQASNTINAMTGYVKANAVAAISATDSLNTAIGKLEKALDGKQAAGSYAVASHNHDTAYLGKTATAAAATKLATARTINGVAFDGTANITVTDSSKVAPTGTIVANRIAVFNDTTGKVIKDSGFTIATSVPANAKFTDTIYTHPSSHDASMITQSSSYRFVTDSEKSTWNSKSNLVLGTTSSTAFRGDQGLIAYNHSQVAHAPANAQKNSDITKAEIEAKLTGAITTHTHNYAASNHNHNGTYTRKYAANIGDGTNATIKVTHNLGTEDVTVTVREVSTKQIVMADIQIYDSNSINILFASAPASSTYRVVVTG